jgi:superfamily I DNA/RNA helicase
MATFWLGKNELDAEQGQAVEGIPESSSFLLRGPAGSGKTNILLLRAKWMTLKSISDFRIIVFTSSLRKFLAAGCEQYGINPESVVTQMTFFRNLLQEYSVPFELSKNFEVDRNMLAGKVMSLIEEKNIPSTYCEAILVDEAQDYTDTELLVFRRLTNRLVLASDSRQSIYRTTHTPGLPEKIVDHNVVTLKYHYRSGLRLCKVADAILADSENYPRLQGESRYDEKARPSSVARVSCPSFVDQQQEILANLRNQLDLYADERIGVLFPKREQAQEFERTLEGSDLADSLESEAIWVDTLHGAKGWEFRAVHLGGCEVLPKMGATQKRLIYTGVLRGKTSAHVYFSGHVPGYLDSALATVEPPKAKPKLDDLF